MDGSQLPSTEEDVKMPARREKASLDVVTGNTVRGRRTPAATPAATGRTHLESCDSSLNHECKSSRCDPENWNQNRNVSSSTSHLDKQ